ncbi:MAG TPA: sulfatase-like hydrolase/transferase, partial [Vicinamibacteria bacterium]|nr:sulfatase-like hydrolase/transferase [Vicinamibacteria bacterium]
HSLRSEPVSVIVARQLGNLRTVAPPEFAPVEVGAQRLDSNLYGLGSANVFLIFLESYGVTLLEDAHHFEAIAPRFQALEKHLSEAGYSFSSSQIQSPTFGGGSWRAHASLLSGFQAENEHLYNGLLASDRKTLVHVMKARGYRTVAAEPGIKWYWPDGLFYGFDRIYDFDALDYKGPSMGWWKIPDQFTLYRIYKNEVAAAEGPLFAKFSLIMTHIPYYPVPPYVADWTRFDDGTAFQSGLESVAHDAYRDLMELSRWYVDAFRYEIDCLEGFLIDYVPENSLVIIVGDHQPPKLATHDNDSWAVPMHVLSKREELVRAFDSLGFEPGLVPLRPSSLRMADFLEGFLDIYDVREAD